MEGLIFGGVYVRGEICVSKLIGLACSGKEIYHFCFVLLCIRGQIPSTSPPRGLYLEGRFNGGFLRYDIGGLIFGGAYFWNFTVLVYWSITLLLSHIPRPATTSRHFCKPWEYKRTRVSEKHSCKNMLPLQPYNPRVALFSDLTNVHEIYHIQELQKCNQMKNDSRSSKRNLCNCERSLKKKFRTSIKYRDLNTQ